MHSKNVVLKAASGGLTERVAALEQQLQTTEAARARLEGWLDRQLGGASHAPGGKEIACPLPGLP